MVKKGNTLVGKPQSRWFVLRRGSEGEGEIHYYDSEGEARQALRGTIGLAGVRPEDVCRLRPGSTSDFAFTIATPKRKWVLNPGSQAGVDEWRKQIIGVLRAGAGPGAG